MEERSDRFTAIEHQYAGYTVVDEGGSKIGKVDDLFLDENDQPEYLGVKMGFLGTSSTLIPADIATINNEQGSIEISQPKSTVKDGPAFDDDREITPEYENEVRSYYGLDAATGTEDRGTYADYSSGALGAVGPGMREGDTGQLKVRKRVRTDREHIEVPARHEEVSVERVPVEGDASEAEIGDDEVVVPVTEEEVVVHKRPVLKEEVRIRKDVVEEREVVEEDVRREEVEVEDETERGRGTDR